MRMKLFHILFCLVVIQSLFSQVGGLGVYKFLDLPVPARTSSLGGNTIALKDDDLTLAFQNPALLSSSVSSQAAFSIVDYFGDIKHGYTAYARKFEKLGTFSGSVQFVNYGNFQSADETGNINGTFSAADYSFNLSYAKQKDSSFSYGINLKTIYSKYERYFSVGNAIDIGFTYVLPNKNTTIAFVARNFGYQWISYSGTGKEKLHSTTQLAISKKVPKAPFRLHLAYQFLEKWDLTYSDPANPEPTVDPITGEAIKEKKLNKFMDKLGRHLVAGAELILTKNFNIRLGYNFMRAQEYKLPDRKTWGGLTFGLGLKVYKFHISYGHANYHIAGGSNHFTLTCNLSELRKK